MKENWSPTANVPFGKRKKRNGKEPYFEPKTSITLATSPKLNNLENCSGPVVVQFLQIGCRNWFLSVTERLGSGSWFPTIIRMRFRLWIGITLRNAWNGLQKKPSLTCKNVSLG